MKTINNIVCCSKESTVFRQKEDVEEFGTGTSSTNSSVKIDNELAKKKSIYKTKKLHLYADDLESRMKRLQRNDEEEEEEEDDHYNNRYQKPKRFKYVLF